MLSCRAIVLKYKQLSARDCSVDVVIRREIKYNKAVC